MALDVVGYWIGDELESLQLWWTASGALVDFSVGHTYAAKLYAMGDTSKTNVFSASKTAGFTGALGSGTKVSGVPNLTVAWSTSGELNAVTAAGRYVFQIVATRVSDNKQRTAEVYFDMKVR